MMDNNKLMVFYMYEKKYIILYEYKWCKYINLLFFYYINTCSKYFFEIWTIKSHKELLKKSISCITINILDGEFSILCNTYGKYFYKNTISIQKSVIVKTNGNNKFTK